MADHSDDDLDALFEDDPAEADYDRKRRAELLRDQEQKKGDFGTYMEKDEKALIDDTTKGCAVVHFAKEDFFRCGVMDTHLRVDNISQEDRLQLTTFTELGESASSDQVLQDQR